MPVTFLSRFSRVIKISQSGLRGEAAKMAGGTCTSIERHALTSPVSRRAFVVSVTLADTV